MSRTSILQAATLARGRPYPERSEEAPPWYDRVAEQLHLRLMVPVTRAFTQHPRRLIPIVPAVAAHVARLRRVSDAELAAEFVGLRQRLRRRGFEQSLVAACFALISEAASRTIGQRHYDCQLIAGWGLLQGRLVEMATGEGKTFAATLPAITAAWSGVPVHVITVNDYLAERDAKELRPLYRFLGLDCGIVVAGMDKAARRDAYSQPITYCSNKELAFDYLRDRVAAARRSSPLHLAMEGLQGRSRPADGSLVLRGLVFGIVDEADSVFIDEARTPLILSTKVASWDAESDCARALELARLLVAGEDYRVDAQNRQVRLEDGGSEKLLTLSGDLGVWSSKRAGEELVTQALSALHLFHLDQQYVVMDGKVQIVDESTGRVMPDRSWERGLHQMIEVKEGCDLSERNETLSRITYQRLFRRYVKLAGMTGTAAEVAGEIKATYRLDITRVPLNRPSRRTRWPDVVCATADEKWRAVADAVDRIARGERRPVLIGTRSVRASEQISAVLDARGLVHELLNAKQDQQEAEVVAAAGGTGRVTVATNMAGRGTDIKLAPGVAARGGLHVILTEYHESRRVDRQLLGRCARQGDPGTCQAIVALDDELYRVHARVASRAAAALVARWPSRARPVVRALTRLAQAAAERRNAFVRTQNLQSDLRIDKTLAFSGRGE
jgi:preprotein translocase subunit SecA